MKKVFFYMLFYSVFFERLFIHNVEKIFKNPYDSHSFKHLKKSKIIKKPQDEQEDISSNQFMKVYLRVLN